MSVVEAPALPHDTRPLADTRPRTTPAVVGWAVAGGIFVALQLFIYAKWILGPDFKRVPTGEDQLPGWMEVSLRVQEVGFFLGVLALAYFTIGRPLLRRDPIGWNGLWVIAVASVIWQDPLYSALNLSHSYNSYMVNFGSWAPDIPGWVAPNAQNLANPIFWDLGVYPLLFAAGSFVVVKVMRRIQARRPALGKVGMAAILFCILMVVDFVLEVAWMRLGAASYAAEFDGWTIFRGNYYQFPVFEAVLLSGVWTAFAMVCFYRDDRGLSFPERGIEKVRLGRRGKTVVRALALCGVVNTIALIYPLVMPYITAHSSRWSEDVTSRSYFQHGLCGEGTNVACPSNNIPIPREGGALKVGPSGRLGR